MNQMLKTWGNVIAHPREATLANELDKDYATQKNAISWLAIGILLAAGVKGFNAFLYETIFHSFVGSRQAMAMLLFRVSAEDSELLNFFGSPIFGGIASFVGFLLGAPIVLFLGNLAVLWLAKAMGGTGSSEKQLFAAASIAPGLLIAAHFFGLIRQLNICLVFPVVWTHAIILSILAVKSIHGLSTAKSAIAVVVPFLVFTVVVVVLFPPHW